MQRDARSHLTVLAVTFGYADLPAMDREFRNHLGVAPSRVRNSLGWEWLAWRWLTRARA